ncbi:MAG: 16S rRNA (cytidine(1402)-2'-O)-methyltransferase [Lachnospiraceae bacterium]|nr:16S rRNA (cytidine(1402)-2'-O)-methyltransferase [Lachnospiraceae bacterium]MCI1328867.1 16S rRNA (cytidine(1402)-2'-O)-methyltransferase [Lachnospiraceae bacterium]
MPGKLILCATPIGNLEDITMRVLRALKEADLIAAEDTRNSIRLLNHFDIHTPMTSYHEYNKYQKGKTLVERMQKGETIALITDAGTPAISDPGFELVNMAYDAGIEVTSLPGPAAFVTALTLSGMPPRRFVFESFLPDDKKARRAILEDLRDEMRTIILYEAPHHLVQTLTELAAVLGEDRSVSLCRELTKKHETVTRTTIGGALDRYREESPRGEFVLVIAGKPKGEAAAEAAAKWESVPLPEHMRIYTDQGIDRKEAMKRVAKDRGVTKREIYRQLLDLE